MIEPTIGKPFKYESKWYVARKEKRCSCCGPKDRRCVFHFTKASDISTCMDIIRCKDSYIRPARLRNLWASITRDARPGSVLDRFGLWVENDPIGQRFWIGAKVVWLLTIMLVSFGFGLLAGRGGL